MTVSWWEDQSGQVAGMAAAKALGPARVPCVPRRGCREEGTWGVGQARALRPNSRLGCRHRRGQPAGTELTIHEDGYCCSGGWTTDAQTEGRSRGGPEAGGGWGSLRPGPGDGRGARRTDVGGGQREEMEGTFLCPAHC